MRNNKTILEKKYNLTITDKTIKCNICDYVWTVKRLRYNRNTSCPNCHPFEHGSSKNECELYDLLLTTGLNIIHNDRTALNGKELDIYFPDLKFAIEYDGEYWHNKEDDELKNKLCKEKGIELIRISDKDYNDLFAKFVVINYLNNKYHQNVSLHPELVKDIIRVSGKSKKIICTDTMEVFSNYIEAANRFNCKQPSFICNVCNGNQPHYKGYHFKYYDEKEIFTKTEIGYNYNSQHIECIETGEVFESISVLKKIGVKSIWDCINGKQTTANKLHWRKTKKETTNTEATVKLLNINNSIAGKQIVCIETGEIFPSCQSVADKFNITKEAVSQACKNNSMCKGFHFKFTGIETFGKRTDSTKIKCIETNEMFNSAKEVAIKFNICEEAIRRNCLGKTKITKAGYTFEYVGKTKTIRNDNIKFKKVKNLTTGEIYNSIKECASKLNAPNENSIARVCRGERKSYKGYKLEYLTE